MEMSPFLSRFSGRTCDPIGDPPCSSQFLKDCIPWKRPHAGAREEHVEESAADTRSYEQTVAPIACPPALLSVRGLKSWE